MMAELWLIGTALAFVGLDLIGINDPEARFLIVLVAALLSIDVLAGVVCLLKGHIGIGFLAVTAWLALPIAVAISSLVFLESLDCGVLRHPGRRRNRAGGRRPRGGDRA